MQFLLTHPIGLITGGMPQGSRLGLLMTGKYRWSLLSQSVVRLKIHKQPNNATYRIRF